ncbi:hypothetical protein L596_003998 [Steinernema carpocapsae]|uniref:Uncharacterized protein n=1 Tax=Steinernema carpocapsae TaxID=34508 RepID=A0A4V6I863_STECR|nr:hypothetical protein L596_003998 [Steinernema carpocapsae]
MRFRGSGRRSYRRDRGPKEFAVTFGQREAEIPQKDEDHSNEETGLLGSSADSGVSDDSDSVSGSKTAKAAGEAGGEMGKSLVEGVASAGGADLALQDHGDDQAVDTNDTGHNDGDDRLHDQLGTHHSHGADADGGLGRSVGGSKDGSEPKQLPCSRRTAHRRPSPRFEGRRTW